jgi:hypothetical protein
VGSLRKPRQSSELCSQAAGSTDRSASRSPFTVHLYRPCGSVDRISSSLTIARTGRVSVCRIVAAGGQTCGKTVSGTRTNVSGKRERRCHTVIPNVVRDHSMRRPCENGATSADVPILHSDVTHPAHRSRLSLRVAQGRLSSRLRFCSSRLRSSSPAYVFVLPAYAVSVRQPARKRQPGLCSGNHQPERL